MIAEELVAAAPVPKRRVLDPKVRDELITRYAYLVRFVVGRLAIRIPVMLETEDAMSYGVMGLIEAVDRFDPARGVKFETFAIPIIRASIIGALRKLSVLPRTAHKRASLIHRTMAALAQELGREPTDAEVAAAVGMTQEEYWKALTEASWAPISLDHSSAHSDEDDQSLSLLEVVDDPTAPDPLRETEREDLQRAVARSIELLPEREQLILSLYYYEELTLREIGEILNVSECRVSQLHARAIARIRRMVNG